MYEQAIVQYRRYLAERHHQWTWQRQVIAGAMLARNEFSPEELLTELVPRGMTRPGFFRVLSELLDAGIAAEARTGATCVIRIAR